MLSLLFAVGITILTVEGASASNFDDARLFVFVGKKLKIEEFDPPPCVLEEADKDVELECINLDAAFIARYQVLEPVYGSYRKRTIEFEIYSHWGLPMLSNARHSLMFVWVSPERKLAPKYLYFEVHKTRNGRWAACGDPFLEYEGYESRTTRIRFRKQISYKVEGFSAEQRNHAFPDRFYKVQKDKAVCRGWGLYAEQLYDLAQTHSWQLETLRQED